HALLPDGADGDGRADRLHRADADRAADLLQPARRLRSVPARTVVRVRPGASRGRDFRGAAGRIRGLGPEALHWSLALRTVRATRYVTPLREGGSLPAIVEADDLGMYVVKFRGAGQGPQALVAELIGGEIGRALGLPVPELVFVEVASDLGRNEPDQEIRELLSSSAGVNLALDYLPGSVMFDPAAGDRADAELASRVVWF